MTPAQHAATVLHGLEAGRAQLPNADWSEEFAALDALVALAERATELEADYERQREYADEQYRKALAEHARAHDLELELIQQRQQWVERAVQAEARATELETALDVQKETARVLETQRDHWLGTYKREHNTRHAMEDTIAKERARATELERAIEIPRRYDVLLGEWKDRAERAETALRRIEIRTDDPVVREVARAALGETAPPGPRYGCAPGCRADAGAGLHKPECRVPALGETAP